MKKDIIINNLAFRKNNIETYNHLSVITKGGKPICYGQNTSFRTCYKSNIMCSMHAELNVIYKYINSYSNSNYQKKYNSYDIRRKMKKIKLYVTQSNLGNSIPCSHCFSQMNILCIGKIIFTINDKKIITIKNNTDIINYDLFIRPSEGNEFNKKYIQYNNIVKRNY